MVHRPADAIYQSLNLIYDEDPDYIVVFGADHVYRMDPEQMVKFHVESGAGATVAGIRVPRSEAVAFGCIGADESGRIRSFTEKPAEPPLARTSPDQTFVSMGNYIFTTDVLINAIREDADDDSSDHDMGGNIIPKLVDEGRRVGIRLQRQRGARCHGTRSRLLAGRRNLDAFYDAHMDLVSVHPVFNLYNKRWPIRGVENLCAGEVRQRWFGSRSRWSGQAASFRRPRCATRCCRPTWWSGTGPSWRGVLMPGVRVGRGAVVRRAILDKNVVVGPGEHVGVDLDRDRARFAISTGGVVAVGKGVWI